MHINLRLSKSPFDWNDDRFDGEKLVTLIVKTRSLWSFGLAFGLEKNDDAIDDANHDAIDDANDD